MPVGSLRELLRDADKKGYGVPALFAFNYETMKLAVTAAEECRMPCILMLYPGVKRYIPMGVFAVMAKAIADRTKIPVGIHLDHCSDPAEIRKAIATGFGSVMFDGSALTYEENARRTREVAVEAHTMGVDVEAELGFVGSGSNREDFLDSSRYTNPGDAARFVDETGVDALAVAVGNSHGNYAEEPRLDIPRLKEIHSKGGAPIVLHGASHVPDAQLKEAVLAGAAKVNIATEYLQRCGSAVQSAIAAGGWPSILQALIAAQPDVLEFLVSRFRLLNPGNINIL